jgi:DNA mismatch repair protein MutS
MVEMTETANILNNATPRSLIVLDEIGRGTSTYDGISVAWATLEYICSEIKARTLFATHYHELTKLSQSIPRLANAHMAVESEGTGAAAQFRFLYVLKEGPANESIGIHVARLAGIPKAVVSRAWKVLDELERSSKVSAQVADTNQLSLFAMAPIHDEPVEPTPHPVLTQIDQLDPNRMTPLEALSWLAKLQEMSRESDSKSS